jgi:23S rRNA (uracil1939-C5)-methyltransferase
MSDVVEIARLGHAGDGVTADGLFVPLTVPGDVVRIRRNENRAQVEEIISPGPARITPGCRHFGRCGGCALQMMAHKAYLAWKRELVIAALHQRGIIDPPVEAIRAVAAQSRRRAMLKCRKPGHQLLLGFYESDSHRLVDIAECPVLMPELTALLAPLKQALGGILHSGEQTELHVTASDTGLDLALKLARRRDPDLLMEFSRLAAELNLARLCWNGEPVVVNTMPVLRIGRINIALPPVFFCNPAREAKSCCSVWFRTAPAPRSASPTCFAAAAHLPSCLRSGGKSQPLTAPQPRSRRSVPQRASPAPVSTGKRATCFAVR